MWSKWQLMASYRDLKCNHMNHVSRIVSVYHFQKCIWESPRYPWCSDTDSQGSLRKYCFVVTLSSSSRCHSVEDVLQCLWELLTGKKVSTRQEWMKALGSSTGTSTNKITICSHFHIDWLQPFHRFFDHISWEWSTTSVQSEYHPGILSLSLN